MGSLGRKFTVRVGLAMMLMLVLSAGVVIAAGPRPHPAPGHGTDAAPAAATIKLVGWAGSVRSAGAQEALVRLVTVNGTFDVLVNAETRILRSADGKPMAPGDLAAAMPLDVQGRVTEEARIAANVITAGVLPPTTPSEQWTLRGRILATFGFTPVTADRRLVVITTTRGEAVLEVDDRTLIVDSLGLTLSFGALQAGAAVLVEALGSTQAVARAVAIEVSTAGRAPQVTVDGQLVARGALPDSGERWIVGEVLILVPRPLAASNGRVAVGTRVSVTAQRNQSGELEALRVRVPAAAAPQGQIVELRGRVDRVDGATFVVDGIAVGMGAELVAPAGLAAGVFVKVRARLDVDGSLTAEAIDLLTPGKVDVQFEGPVESVAADVWRVSGVTVRLTAETVVVGDPPTVGSHAEVSGTQLAARTVEARRIKVSASVTPAWSAVEGSVVDAPKPPAVWRIVGQNKDETEVVVTETTIIDESLGVARVGAWVQVHGSRDKNNRVEAERIRVRRSAQ